MNNNNNNDSVSEQRAANAFTRRTLLVIVFLIDLTMAVFASLALFRAVAAENWWALGLNILQVVYTAIVYYMIGGARCANAHERQLLLRAFATALLMCVLRATWQGVAQGDDAEEITESSESGLFTTYLGLGVLRLAVFIEQLFSIVHIFVLVPSAAAAKANK